MNLLLFILYIFCRDEKQDQEDVSNLLESIDRAKLNASSEDSVSSPNSQRIYRKDDPIFKRLNCVTKEELGSHLRCSHCFVDFSTRHRYRYLDHVESHRQEKFTDCQYCGMLFLYLLQYLSLKFDYIKLSNILVLFNYSRYELHVPVPPSVSS